MKKQQQQINEIRYLKRSVQELIVVREPNDRETIKNI